VGIESFLRWTREMAELSNWCGIKYDGKKVIEFLTGLGYTENAFTGKNKVDAAGFLTDEPTWRHWWIGQIIDMLSHPPYAVHDGLLTEKMAYFGGVKH